MTTATAKMTASHRDEFVLMIHFIVFVGRSGCLPVAPARPSGVGARSEASEGWKVMTPGGTIQGVQGDDRG